MFGVAKKDVTHIDSGWNNDLLHREETRARSASVMSVCPPWPAGLVPQLTQGDGLYVCTLLVFQAKDPITSSPGTDVALVLARCHMAHTEQRSKH